MAAENMDSAMAGDVEMGAAVAPAPVSLKDTEARVTGRVTKIGPELGAGKMSEQLDELVAKHHVLVISRTWCPFCLEAKSTLDGYGVPYAVLEVNEHPQGNALFQELASRTEHGTVPAIYIGGEFIGGCNQLKTLEFNGELAVKLAAKGDVVNTPPTVGVDEKRISGTGLFRFPETADGNVVRLVAGMVVLQSILCIAFFREPGTRWFVLGLAIDFVLRFLGGARVSIKGLLATALLSRVPPKFVAGPPKQFAALCGIMFSVTAAGCYLGGQEVAGAVVLAMLVGAASLEFFLNFCLGCWMFGWAIRLGILKGTVYRAHLNLRDLKKNGYEYVTSFHEPSGKPNAHVLMPWQQGLETPVDLIRKERFEDEKLSDVSVVRHTRISFFLAPMTLAAMGYVFKFLYDTRVDPVLDFLVTAWKVVAGVGAAAFVIFGCIYALRCVLHFNKVWKEFNHPITGHFFSVIPITILIFSLLTEDRNEDLGEGLLWLGALLQMALSVQKIADMIYTPLSQDMLTPASMMAPVGNFIAALSMGAYATDNDSQEDINYPRVALLWFGVAFFFFIALFAVTFNRAILDHHSDARLRPTLWVWLAASSVAGPAYAAVNTERDVSQETLYQSLYTLSLFLFAVLAWGSVKKSFFAHEKFTMECWTYGFACCALALSAIDYHVRVGSNEFTKVLAYLAVALAAWVTSVVVLHTIHLLVDGLRLFLPSPKWGPLSLMRLTHEALRVELPRLEQLAEQMVGESAEAAAARSVFAKRFALMEAAYSEHGRHEDLVFFKAARRYFPGLETSMDEEHEHEHAVLDEMLELLPKLSAEDAGISGPAAASMRDLYMGWCVHVLNHLRHEEVYVTKVMRKYVPVEVQRQLTREAYHVTPPERWLMVFPFILANLNVPMWKIRYVKAFTWAMPELAQQIGLMVYRSVDAPTWAFLKEKCPEIIPRGVSGFRRYY